MWSKGYWADCVLCAYSGIPMRGLYAGISFQDLQDLLALNWKFQRKWFSLVRASHMAHMPVRRGVLPRARLPLQSCPSNVGKSTIEQFQSYYVQACPWETVALLCASPSLRNFSPSLCSHASEKLESCYLQTCPGGTVVLSCTSFLWGTSALLCTSLPLRTCSSPMC